MRSLSTIENESSTIASEAAEVGVSVKEKAGFDRRAAPSAQPTGFDSATGYAKDVADITPDRSKGMVLFLPLAVE